MARALRIKYEGAIYHVTIRGNGRKAIFVDERDRERFVKRFAESVELYEVRVYLYCLLANHVHVVLETPKANLSQFMHSVQTGYAVYFNLRHGECGHVFQGRYGAKLVEGDKYLLALSRYVHLNPVHIAKVQRLAVEDRIKILRAYKWSSYRGYIGLAKAEEFADYGPMLAQMSGRSRLQKQKAYRTYVESGLAETDEDFQKIVKASPHSIGTEMFRQWVNAKHLDLMRRQKRKEDVAFRKRTVYLPAEVVLEIVLEEFGVEKKELGRRSSDSMLRPVAARLLNKYAGLTQRQIGGLFHVETGAAISAQLKKLNGEMTTDRRLKRTMQALEKRLTEQASNLTFEG